MLEETNSFDRTFREILQCLPKKFIEILFRKQVVEVLDPSFPSVKERVVDFAGSESYAYSD